MNNIHEKDWAADCWSGHTGMDSFSDYCAIGDQLKEGTKEAATPGQGSLDQGTQPPKDK